MTRFGLSLCFAFLGCFLLSLPAIAAEPRQKARSLTLPSGEKVDYLFYQPREIANSAELPLLFFLHGGGESGDDLEKVKTHGPPREIEEGRDYPMIVVSPLNPEIRGFWDEDRLTRFRNALESEIKFDRQRLYLAGMSRGGYGAYRLAMENPDRFGAMLVLCGVGPSPYAGWLGKLPTWIIHREKDPVIPISESVRMAKAIEEKDGDVTLTIDPDAGHDVWTETFRDPKVVKWFLEHRRAATP